MKSKKLTTGNIIERIYEAALLPELWVALLDDLARMTGASFGGVGIYSLSPRGITTSFKISDGPAPWQQSPEATKRWLAFIRSSSHINAGFFQIDPFAGDWSDIADFRERFEHHVQRGIGVQTGTIIELFNGEVIVLEFAKRLDEPRFEEPAIAWLNSLNTAFRHSVSFASRLQFARMQSSLQTLSDLGLPAALLGENGQVIYTNELFESVESHITILPSGMLAVKGNDNLRNSFAKALQIANEKRSVSIALPAINGKNAAVIELLPVVGDAKAILVKPCTILIVSPIGSDRRVPSSELVSKLFGLTPTEARLAVALASGLSLRDCAARQGITIGTARAYLIRIFYKTGTSQQSELVSLLKSIHSWR